jgi:glycosyltransferase involved in cell wall biosynthesis
VTTISAVIRAFNEEAHLGRLLHGLAAQTQPPDEVILVDSGSSDRTVDVAEAAGARIVTIARDEFTFGRALNRGCEAAGGDALLIVSAHVYPLYDDYLEHLAAPLEHADIALAYGRQVGDHRTKYAESRVMSKWFPKDSVLRQRHPFSSNANALVRRAVWEKLRYREELTGLEDLDFAKRAIESGDAISYVAEAPVVHVHEESWEAIQNRYRREAIAYRDIYPDAEMTRRRAAALALGNVASDWWHAIREHKLAESHADVVRFRLAQFRGAYLGLSSDHAPEAELLRRFYYPPEWVRRPAEPLDGNEIEYSAWVTESEAL